MDFQSPELREIGICCLCPQSVVLLQQPKQAKTLAFLVFHYFKVVLLITTDTPAIISHSFAQMGGAGNSFSSFPLPSPSAGPPLGNAVKASVP